MRFFEIFAIAIVLISISFFSYCENRKKYFLLFIISLFTVSAGEFINMKNSTTIYNNSFFMFPGTKLPLFIIPLGAIISVWTFFFTERIAKFFKKNYFQFFFLFLVSVFFPFLSELIGVKMGIWKWNVRFELSFFFLLGIWKFYFIFIFSPVLLFSLFSIRKN